MSAFTATPGIGDYVARGAAMLNANTQLRGGASPKVNAVIVQEPPIEQAPLTAVMPVIFVCASKNSINRVEVAGRDSLDAAGARIYHLEFYNVVVVRGRGRQNAQTACQGIAAIVRDTYQRNTRMLNPGSADNPLCSDSEVAEIPYVLRVSTPDVQAINVLCRPVVPVSLRA